MLYESIIDFLFSVGIWWVIALIFQRMTHRYPNKNTWKKDLLVSLIHSLLIVILLPFIIKIIESLP